MKIDQDELESGGLGHLKLGLAEVQHLSCHLHLQRETSVIHASLYRQQMRVKDIRTGVESFM